MKIDKYTHVRVCVLFICSASDIKEVHLPGKRNPKKYYTKSMLALSLKHVAV